MKSTLLLFVLALFTACAPPREPHPHVVIISIDSIVRDRLGYYGHTPQYAPELEVSPHLDSFATQSAVFDNAWSTTSWTLPAHAALLTGLSDRNHGVEADHFALDPLRTTLGEQFKSAGYTTAGFFTGPYLDPKYGFAKGFDIWDSAMMSPEELARHLDDWMERRARAGMPEPSQEEIRGIRDRVSHWDITSPRVNKGAMDFIEEHKEGDPFLLMLHYFDAHYDYLPDSLEKGLGQRFDPGYVGNMRGENWYFNPAVRAQEPPFERRISERDLGHILALYDAEIHWVDRHIGAVLKSLKDNGLWENTIVAIVADHGDEFFEHGMLGHRSTLFPELTSIPLLIRIPGQFEDGQRIQGLARIFDVGPTLLDYAGLPPLKEAEGKSLRGLLDGSETDCRGILQRVPGGPDMRDAWRDDDYAVHRVLQIDRTATQKWREMRFTTMRDQKQQPMLWVFDRIADPQELNPIPRSDPRWKEAVRRFESAFLQAEAHGNSMPHSVPAKRLAPEMSTEERAMMEQLGYAESGHAPNTPTKRPLMLGPFPTPGRG